MVDTALPETLELKVATPDRLVVSETTLSVSLPGKSGRLGILPGHAPLVSELAAGVLFFAHGGSTQYLAVGGGFAEVLPSRVIVLARTAERAEDIDVARARNAKERAQQQLKKPADSETDASSAPAAWERALARLQAAEQVSRTGSSAPQ